MGLMFLNFQVLSKIILDFLSCLKQMFLDQMQFHQKSKACHIPVENINEWKLCSSLFLGNKRFRFMIGSITCSKLVFVFFDWIESQ